MVLSRIMATSVVVGTLLFSGTALAPSQEDEKCWRKVEDYDVHFSIFQAAFGDRPFCQDAPTTGDTALTLDFTDPALRQMPTEVRVIEADVVGRGPGPRSRRRRASPSGNCRPRPIRAVPCSCSTSSTHPVTSWRSSLSRTRRARNTSCAIRFSSVRGPGNWSLAQIGAVVGFVALILAIVLWLQRRNRQRVIEL